MKNLFVYDTPIGSIAIVANDSVLTHLYFDGESVPTDAAVQETDLLKEAGRQLRLYLSGQLTTFDLPLAPSGADYMVKVWNALCAIPYGQTRSYREIAGSLGNPRAARAVGLANNKNPLPIFIPCHRVVGTNRKLVGYRGGLPLKQKLLDLEGPGNVSPK